MATDDDVPSVIPEVSFDSKGEPVIAREVAVKPSPVPKIIGAVVILMALFSVYQGYEDRQEDRKQQEINRQLIENNKALVTRLGERISQAQREQDRLDALVLAVLTAETPEESRAALEKFIAGREATRSGTPPTGEANGDGGDSVPRQGSSPGGRDENPDRDPPPNEEPPPPPPEEEPEKVLPIPGPTVVCVRVPNANLEVCQ